MTINQMIKKLQKIQDKYGKRIKITVDKKGLCNSTLDYFTHGEVNTIDVDFINWSKDDSYVLADGTERQRIVVVLCQE